MVKTTFTAVLAVVLVVAGLGLATPAVQAQSYTPQNQAQQIAYLQGLIAALQQQLAALTGGVTTPTYQFGYQQTYGPTPNYFQPTTGYYQSPIYSTVVSGVEARTLNPTSIDTDTVTLNGEIRFRGARSVDAYFEYDTDRSYRDRTRTRSINADNDGVSRVSLEIDDIRRGDTYYYRLVVVDNNGDVIRGNEQAFSITTRGGGSSNNDDEPEVDTLSARDIEDDSAELRGEVDMNDFNNGIVFFVYGEDENDVEDVADEDAYNDVDENGDDLQKIKVDNDLDGDADYDAQVTGLDDDTDYYFRICVEYEDEDDDEVLECGDIEEFTTDN